VHAGIDPVTKKRHDLVEIVPAGPGAAKEAEKVRVRLLRQVDEKRNPRTKATVNQLLDKYLSVLNVEATTRDSYESITRNHIRPLLGDLALGRIDGEVLDSFYNQLRTCRAHCRGRKYVEHVADGEHDCDDRCQPHQCRPLADSSLRKIRALLSGAGKRAVRWGWLGVNPFDQTEPIAVFRPDPQPPTPEQAAAIITEAWADLDWGMLVWLAMVTGARRGELCALTWDRFDAKTAVLTIRSSIAQRGQRTWEKDTKTHQQRRITLDPETVALLQAFRRHCAQRAELGPEMPGNARIFSIAPDGRTWLKPDSVSQRYARMCARLGWDMNIHQLRHYSATELITSGVDIRIVAGRLGHGGGGATTLRFYSAWVSEADQRAAGTLATRMPAIPVGLGSAGELMVRPAEQSGRDAPYRRIAADFRGAISCGVLKPGDEIPPLLEVARRYNVAFGTVQRAMTELRQEGLVSGGKGKRISVLGSVSS
jgi:integrase